MLLKGTAWLSSSAVATYSPECIQKLSGFERIQEEVMREVRIHQVDLQFQFNGIESEDQTSIMTCPEGDFTNS